MQTIAPVNQVAPPATYVPPAQRVYPGPLNVPLVQPFRMGIDDCAVFPFVAGAVLGSILS